MAHETSGTARPADPPEPARGELIPGLPDDPDAGTGPAKRHGSFLRELPIILVAALLLSLLIKTFLVQAFYIPSGSMQQTLLVGDRVFVNKLTTRFGEIHRGDIVVFRDPGGWLTDEPSAPAPTGVRGTIREGLQFVGLAPAATGDDLIKRVVGLPGDTVQGRGGKVYVNGVALDEPYVFPGNSPSENNFSAKVPAHKLWVMGDHRGISLDSRAHQSQKGGGFVPQSDVVGRAFVVVWPVSRFGLLHRPSTFDRPALSRN